MGAEEITTGKLMETSEPELCDEQQCSVREHCSATAVAQECKRERRPPDWNAGDGRTEADEAICELV